MEQNVRFNFRVADTVFAVSCLSPITKERCREYLTDEAPDHVITITQADLEAERALPCNALSDPCEQVLENLRLCRYVARLLPSHNTVLFHGSCLALDGQGVLFTAKSGTGKSTHTRLWREAFGDRVSMINDDKPFLRILPQGVTVFGTPWQGKHRLGRNTAVPLKALCILCRGEENRIEPISPKEALPILLQQTFSPVDPQAMVQTLALVQQLSKTVRLYRLYCNMDPQAAQVARDAIFDKENV